MRNVVIALIAVVVLCMASVVGVAQVGTATGQVTAAYRLDEIKRASGLAWVNDSLWIAEFAGQIWQLPFNR